MSDTPEGYGDSAWNESFFDANRNEEQMTEFGASNDDMMEFNSNTEGPGDGESRYFNCSMAELLEAVEKHKPIVEALEAEVKAQVSPDDFGKLYRLIEAN